MDCEDHFLTIHFFAFIYAGNKPKSVLARDLGDCRDNLRNSRSVFLIVELLVTAILTNYLSLYQIFLL